MPRLKMDAIEVASSIHKGDFSKLRGKSFEMCDNKNMVKKYTLNQIGDALFEFIKTTNDNFKQMNTRIDNLEKDIKNRLDYIVKANNLKDLPQNK